MPSRKSIKPSINVVRRVSFPGEMHAAIQNIVEDQQKAAGKRYEDPRVHNFSVYVRRAIAMSLANPKQTIGPRYLFADSGAAITQSISFPVDMIENIRKQVDIDEWSVFSRFVQQAVAGRMTLERPVLKKKEGIKALAIAA